MRRDRSTWIASTSFTALEERRLLSTLIALIDSGVDLQSASDSPYYDFTAAYDAYHQQTAGQFGDQVVQDTSSQHGHGATVADSIIRGVLAAQARPAAATADVKILPIRATSSGLNIDPNALIRGVFWAADHGAAVINLSVNYRYDPVMSQPGDPHYGESLSQAIAYADSKGAVVVTGPGNQALDIDHLLVYPPYSDDPIYSTADPLPSNLLVAAAVDASGTLTPVSSWGAVHVDLGADAGPEGFTSYSAGFTSGVAGVIAALLPPDHSAADVKDVILQTVTPHAQTVGAWSASGGVINPEGAVDQVVSRGVSIDAGGLASGDYHSDVYHSGGDTRTVTEPINTGGVANPAPQQVYQSERYGNFSYTVPHLVPGAPYLVRLDFAETFWNEPGQRLFNVLINENPVLTSFDVLATAGGKDVALTRQFECDADSAGRIIVRFASLRDNAQVCGLTIAPASDLARGKAIYTSSVEGPGYSGAMAVDGNAATRWSSGQWMRDTGTGWIAVDLGASYDISEVRLNWETAYAVNYQVQTSLDGLSWVAIKTVSGNQKPGPVELTGLSGAGRYVRIYCTQTSAGSNNYSLYDFQVYGTPVPDLAYGRPAYSSTVESAYYAPGMAVDGNGATRWSSGQWMQDTSTGWIYVDLGANHAISEVRLNWETAYAVDYQIQTSGDARSWTTIKTVTGNQSKGIVDFTGLAGVGRYVRVYCTRTSAGSNNYSLYDFQVYGTPLPDLAYGRPAYSSTVENASYAPQMAVDGDSGTRWSSGQWMQSTSTGWIYVDLGASYNVAEVRLNWETAYAVDYQIQTSADARSWTTIKTVTGNQSKGIIDITGLAGVGRYVRIYCTQTSTGSNNYSLYDFQVYGTPAGSIFLAPSGSMSSPVDSSSASNATHPVGTVTRDSTAGGVQPIAVHPTAEVGRRTAPFLSRKHPLQARRPRPLPLRHPFVSPLRWRLAASHGRPRNAGAGTGKTP